MSKKILVTGASGFVGRYLIQELVKDNSNQVYAAVYGNIEKLHDLLDSSHLHAGDLTDSEFTLSLIKEVQPDLVYNLAALSVVQNSVERAGQVLSSNILLQYNLLESVRLHAPQARFVAICSANEYGLVDPADVPINESTPLKPLNPYAVSKVSQDMLAYQYFLSYGLDVVRLRPFNHTGAGQTTDFVIPALARQFYEIKEGLREPKIEVGNTDSIRDFTDVRDMVRAYVLAGSKCEAGEVYNIGFGKGIKVSEIIDLFQEIAGVQVEVSVQPDKVRASDVPVLLADSRKFKSTTGWEPQIKFQETLAWVYNSMRSQDE